MTAQRTPFDDAYDKARDHDMNHQEGFMYAARKYIDLVIKDRGLVAQDKVQRELAEDSFLKYAQEKNRGLPHSTAWNATSKWIQRMITGMEGTGSSFTRRGPTAFDTSNDMKDALLPRPPHYPTESLGNLPHRRPPMPAGKGEYHFPAPEYPKARDPGADDYYDRPIPPMPAGKGEFYFPPPIYPEGRTPPPMPAGKGKFKVFEPEYPSSSKSRAKPCYDSNCDKRDKERGYNARTYAPRPTGSRPRPDRSPSPEPYKSYRDPHAKREPPSSWTKPQRDAPPPSSRRHYAPPPPQEEDFDPNQRPKVCFYVVLDIDKSATPDEIKKAYRMMSMKHHPDRAAPGGKTVATGKMAEINQANDVLSDPEQRRYYDRTGRYKNR